MSCYDKNNTLSLLQSLNSLKMAAEDKQGQKNHKFHQKTMNNNDYNKNFN